MTSFPQSDASVRMLVVDTPGYPARRQKAEMAAYARGAEYRSLDDWQIGRAHV